MQNLVRPVEMQVDGTKGNAHLNSELITLPMPTTSDSPDTFSSSARLLPTSLEPAARPLADEDEEEDDRLDDEIMGAKARTWMRTAGATLAETLKRS